MACRYDTDGDGDCPRCVRHGGCLDPDEISVMIDDPEIERQWRNGTAIILRHSRTKSFDEQPPIVIDMESPSG